MVFEFVTATHGCPQRVQSMQPLVHLWVRKGTVNPGLVFGEPSDSCLLSLNSIRAPKVFLSSGSLWFRNRKYTPAPQAAVKCCYVTAAAHHCCTIRGTAARCRGELQPACYFLHVCSCFVPVSEQWSWAQNSLKSNNQNLDMPMRYTSEAGSHMVATATAHSLKDRYPGV